jgi:hypothetical protein
MNATLLAVVATATLSGPLLAAIILAILLQRRARG